MDGQDGRPTGSEYCHELLGHNTRSYPETMGKRDLTPPDPDHNSGNAGRTYGGARSLVPEMGFGIASSVLSQ